MSLAVLYSRAREGINAPLVTIEVDLSNGLPALSIVGLPEMAVRESKDRVRGALINSQFDFPARRITINMAPADLPKEGGRFDLPIAIGILAASQQLPLEPCSQYELLGELALSGELRAVKGVLPVALAARKAGRGLIVPHENAAEAALIKGLKIYPARHILDVSRHLLGQQVIPAYSLQTTCSLGHYKDMADVQGQPHAKRALEIAAAGAHSLLMIGPPGTGKSMLASRIPSILPPMTDEEALETASVLSISEKGFHIDQWKKRPFRAPHHTASGVALVGGGSNPKPGEISLATRGVLFLDELPEFERRVLEVLREPLENGHITISRATRQAEFPAHFQLIAAMNPCPCGYLSDLTSNRCRCTKEQVARYRDKISGPLLDRIDMHIEVPRLSADQLQSGQAGVASDVIRKRVVQARNIQWQRHKMTNSELSGQQLNETCHLQPQAQALMRKAMDKLGLSARAYHRILRLARTIADLAEQPDIQPQHISEAIGFRRMDRRHD